MSIKIYFKFKERHTQGLFVAAITIDYSSLKICSPATFRRLLLIIKALNQSNFYLNIFWIRQTSVTKYFLDLGYSLA